MGRPSGAACSRACRTAASRPTSAASAPAFLKNSRRTTRHGSRLRLWAYTPHELFRESHEAYTTHELPVESTARHLAGTSIAGRFPPAFGAVSALTIVPRRVLGGPGYIAPSDMVLLAQVGCGTQAQRQVNAGMVTRPDLQFVAVVDPNRDSQNYVDWSPWATANRIRKFLEDPSWGDGDTGIRAGRDVARQIMETYYRKQSRPARGIRSYEDFREMLEKETDIQGVVNITPDHQHGPSTSRRCRRARRRSRTSRSRACSTRCGAPCRRRARAPRRRTCSPTATTPIGTRWRRGSTPA